MERWKLVILAVWLIVACAIFWVVRDASKKAAMRRERIERLGSTIPSGEVPTNAIHLMPQKVPEYVTVFGSSNRVSAGGSYSIVLGSNIEVTNEFEFAFGGVGSSPIYRTRMSIDEFIALRNMVSRAMPDAGTTPIDHRHMGKDEYGRPRLHYTTNMPMR